MFAEFGYSTFCAAGAPCQTNVSAVQNQPVMRLCQQWFWEMFCQLLRSLSPSRNDDIPEIINSHDRSRAGMTAPAEGLYLNKVMY